MAGQIISSKDEHTKAVFDFRFGFETYAGI